MTQTSFSFPSNPPALPSEPIYLHPELYDVSYEGCYPREVETFAALIGEGEDKRVLELAAGSGRVTLPLARTGWQMTALDREAAMLDLLARRARAEGLVIEGVCADMAALPDELNGFDAIICPLGVVGMLWKREEIAVHYRRAAAALKPGGRLVYNLAASENPASIIPHNSHWDAALGAVATRSWFQYRQVVGEEEGVVHFVYSILARRGTDVTFMREEGVLRIYSTFLVRWILDSVEELEFEGWFPMYAPEPRNERIPVGDVAGVLVLRRRT